MLAIVRERGSDVVRHSGELFVDAFRWLVEFVLESVFVEFEEYTAFEQPDVPLIVECGNGIVTERAVRARVHE